MKKTIFILTLLLPCCFLFAQPYDADVDQKGNNNSVVVDQYGLDNYAWVKTRGDDNNPSFVDQLGNGVNNSYVDQGTGANPADGNTAVVNQTNNYTEPGDNNESDINQRGDNNTAIVTQIAEMSIHGVARTSTINQNGDGNTATVHQEGRMLDSYIHQGGNDNTGDVGQKGNKLDANIDQGGWANSSIIRQEGYKQDADVIQDGGWSTADQYQGKKKYMDPGTDSRLNEAKIRQNGYSWGSLAEQAQEGKQNYANIIQFASDFGTAMQIQVNVKGHRVGPETRDVNVAEINQRNGLHNEAYQFQHYSTGGDSNFANVYQNGNNNYSLETHWGGGNSSDVDQDGDNNFSDITQNKHSAPEPGYTLPTGF